MGTFRASRVRSSSIARAVASPNEGVTYQDFPKTLATFGAVAVDYPNEQHWIVFDQRVRDRAGDPPVGAARWADAGLGHRRRRRSRSWRTRSASTRRGSPRRSSAGTNTWPLAPTPSFHPGTVRFEATCPGSFPTRRRRCSRPLGEPPFYALPLYNGTLGTSGGRASTSTAGWSACEAAWSTGYTRPATPRPACFGRRTPAAAPRSVRR